MLRRKLKRWALATLIICGGLLLLSGDWTSAFLWTLLTGVSVLLLYAMLATEQDLADERFRPPSSGQDPVALRWIRVSALAAMIVASLDGGRFHWSPSPSDIVRGVAVAGTLLAFLLCFRAMIVNRYFSAVIRIQVDRGHRVVDSGPYALIRHPGYAGMIVGVPLLALALGSWLGFALAIVYSLLIVRRVWFEDRYLRENLPGYPAYASRVRFRLVPGVW
jgi:protein-S-isoprenylcysteine O-methyltransferase Ste14